MCWMRSAGVTTALLANTSRGQQLTTTGKKTISAHNIHLTILIFASFSSLSLSYHRPALGQYFTGILFKSHLQVHKNKTEFLLFDCIGAVVIGWDGWDCSGQTRHQSPKWPTMCQVQYPTILNSTVVILPTEWYISLYLVSSWFESPFNSFCGILKHIAHMCRLWYDKQCVEWNTEPHLTAKLSMKFIVQFHQSTINTGLQAFPPSLSRYHHINHCHVTQHKQRDRPVLLLTCSVQYVQQTRLTINDDLLSVRVLCQQTQHRDIIKHSSQSTLYTATTSYELSCIVERH